MRPVWIALTVLVLAACAPLRPLGVPFAPPCLPEGVSSADAWSPIEMRWNRDTTGQAWVDAFYLVQGRLLRVLWLGTGEVALIDPDPQGVTPAWIDPGVLVPQSGLVRARSSPAQTCQWERAPTEGGRI